MPESSQPSEQDAGRARGGFTLIEALVVVGIVGILLSLAVPVLAIAQSAARRTLGLSNIRESVALIDRHRDANEDRYPRVVPGAHYPLTFSSGGLASGFGDIWPTEVVWWSVIRETAPLTECWRLWVSPGRSAEPPVQTAFVSSIRMSHSFLALGSLWTEQSQGRPPEQLNALLHPVRGGQVAYPASKVLLYDHDAAFERRPPPRQGDGMPRCRTVLGFADGHAELGLIFDSLPPTRNPLLAILDPVAAERPVHNTTNGVQGRDF